MCVCVCVCKRVPVQEFLCIPLKCCSDMLGFVRGVMYVHCRFRIVRVLG